MEIKMEIDLLSGPFLFFVGFVLFVAVFIVRYILERTWKPIG
jgi:hypothetical protein